MRRSYHHNSSSQYLDELNRQLENYILDCDAPFVKGRPSTAYPNKENLKLFYQTMTWKNVKAHCSNGLRKERQILKRERVLKSPSSPLKGLNKVKVKNFVMTPLISNAVEIKKTRTQSTVGMSDLYLLNDELVKRSIDTHCNFKQKQTREMWIKQIIPHDEEDLALEELKYKPRMSDFDDKTPNERTEDSNLNQLYSQLYTKVKPVRGGK